MLFQRGEFLPLAKGGKEGFLKRSDVDLLVEFEPSRKTFDNFITLTFLLEDHLQRRVELVPVESLSPYIGPSILEEVKYASLAA
jgi:predicted nucleotidyltransferase